MFLNIRLSGIFVLRNFLKDQHGIAVTEEAIVFLDSQFVSVHDQVVSAKGADHDQQA